MIKDIYIYIYIYTNTMFNIMICIKGLILKSHNI
jgi:hypothetical protein